MGRAEKIRPGDHGDSPMAQADQMPRRLGRALAVIGHHHAIGRIQGYRGDAHIGTSHLGQHAGDTLVFGNRRRQDGAEQFLAHREAAHIGHEVVAGPVAGMHHQLEARSANSVQNPLLHVHHIVGAGVVVDHADQERAPERKASRLGVGRKAQFGDHRLDLLAGVRLDEGRLVDDPRDGLLGYAGDAGDVVDGRRAAWRQAVVGRARVFAVVFDAAQLKSRPSRISRPLHSGAGAPAPLSDAVGKCPPVAK